MSEIRMGIKSMINSMKEKINTTGAKALMRNMQEKMNSLGAQTVLNTTSAKLKEMVSNMQAKLKDIGAESMMNNRRAKMKERGAETTGIKNLQENLEELLKMVEKIGQRIIMSPPDKELPLETKREKLQQWFYLNGPYVVMGLILLFLLWGCCRCFRYCCRMKTVKMMKAPGRNFRIPRPNFEANPRSYFRNLHSIKPKYG